MSMFHLLSKAGEYSRVSVAHSALPSLHNHDGVTLLEDLERHRLTDTPLDALVDILLPVDLGEVRLALGEQERVDTTVQVTKSARRSVSGDHEDGAHGAVLGEQTGRVTGGGEDQDGTGVHVQRGTHGGHGGRLDDADGALAQLGHLLEVRQVRDGVLGLQASLVHLVDSLARVRSLGGLTRQHDTVSSISHSISDVRNLCTGRARVVDHGLQHLGGADDGLAGNVAHGDHLLLRAENLRGRDLDTEITTGDHDSVGLLENLSEVVETLSVLDLGDDLDVRTIVTKDLTDVLDVLAAADERGKDHVDVVLDTEAEIGLVLLGEGGEIDVGVGEVDTLLGGDLAVVAGAAADRLLVHNREDIECKHTVVNVDDAAGLDHLGDVLVVDVPAKVRSCEVSITQTSQ
jgi:hypothetical protein